MTSDMANYSQKQRLGNVDIGSPLIRKALLNSLTDGIFASVMTALAETFCIAAAVKLSAPAMTIALLGSAPLLIGSIGQFFLPLFLKKGQTRKHYVVASVRVQAMFLLLAALTGWLPKPYDAWAYVFAFVLYGSSGNMFAGIWTSWLRDLVPQPIRGRHFAWRNRFFSLTQMVCAVSAGIVSRKYSSANAPWMFFTVIFFIGSMCRFVSGQFISRQYEPAQARFPTKAQVWHFTPSKNFVWFCLSIGLFQAATAISGPFFNVWFLRELKFDYLTFTLATASTIAGTILFLPLWGKLIDTIGTSRVLRITGFMCTFVPIPYLFFGNPVSVWLSNFYSGMSWGGFNVANFSYLLRTTEKEKSDHYIAFASATTAICQFAFSLLGGFLSTRLPIVFTYQLQTLFCVSMLGRLAVIIVFFGKFSQPQMRVDGEDLTPFVPLS